MGRRTSPGEFERMGPQLNEWPSRVIHTDPGSVKFHIHGPAYRRGMSDADFAAACRELRGVTGANTGGPYVFWGIDWASSADADAGRTDAPKPRRRGR